MTTGSSDIARGVGPWGLRVALVGVAGIYFFMLLKPPELHGAARTITFFAQSTALFPNRDTFSTEFRLEGWSCTSLSWVPMDMRPYFPLRADDKESRFQRLAYFYQPRRKESTAEHERERLVFNALDDYLVARHADGTESDAVIGPIGGIRVYEVQRAIPPIGSTIERYEFQPLAPVPPTQRVGKYYTKASQRAQRCGRAVPDTMSTDPSAADPSPGADSDDKQADPP